GGNVGTGEERIYTFSPAASGTFVVSTCGSNYDTVLYIRDGGFEGTELGCNDDAGCGCPSACSDPARYPNSILTLSAGAGAPPHPARAPPRGRAGGGGEEFPVAGRRAGGPRRWRHGGGRCILGPGRRPGQRPRRGLSHGRRRGRRTARRIERGHRPAGRT